VEFFFVFLIDSSSSSSSSGERSCGKTVEHIGHTVSDE
jgi:hypothetical protein